MVTAAGNHPARRLHPPRGGDPVAAACGLSGGFAARAAAYDRDGSFPFENFSELFDGGLLSLTVPAALGGGGAGARTAARVLGTIGQADPSIAPVLAMHYVQHLLMARGARWPDQLVRKLARDSLEGIALVDALRVEPELGSPARGRLPATIARRSATGWRLTGRKIYSTGAPILTWYVVWARTDEPETRVGMFLVPAGLPGTRIIESWNHLGLRASGGHDVIFEDVTFPLHHEIDVRAPEAWSPPDPSQTVAHGIFIAAIYDGIARAARDRLIGFLRDRKPANLGAPLATLPRVQGVPGGVEARLTVNARLIDGLGRDFNDGLPLSANESNIIKLTVTNNAVAAVEDALSLTGNHGLSRTNPLERHHRDVLCGRVHRPQDDATRLSAGRLALSVRPPTLDHDRRNRSIAMSIEFIGFITNNNSSETIVRAGPVLDPPYIETVAKAHELAGFDRALLAFHSTTPDALQVAQHVLQITRSLKVMIAQRPGFTAPTLLARQLATLDQFHGGRVSLHVITGGNASELRQDGNTLDDKDERYARTSEFLDIVRLEWTSEKPFDYRGKYYTVERGFSLIKPRQPGGICIFVGGASDAAIETAGKHADTFALWGESYGQVREQIAKVRAAAAKHGRSSPRFSLSVRPILADTEEQAWAKAQAILERAAALQDQTGYRRPADGHATAGARRLLALADQGARIDKRLWTEIAKLTGANSNTTALVGTPEQVAEVFGDYYELGISHFLIRGFDPLVDAIDYGRALIPLTRRLIAERNISKGAAAE